MGEGPNREAVPETGNSKTKVTRAANLVGTKKSVPRGTSEAAHKPHYDASMAEQPITGFHQDEAGDWVADLLCGHTQHVRHRPPWELRPWVVSEEGRRAHVGCMLHCKKCDEEATARAGMMQER